MANLTPASSPDMSITIKVLLVGKDENRKFTLPLKELGATSLPGKVRLTLPLTAFFQVTAFHLFDTIATWCKVSKLCRFG